MHENYISIKGIKNGWVIEMNSYSPERNKIKGTWVAKCHGEAMSILDSLLDNKEPDEPEDGLDELVSPEGEES